MPSNINLSLVSDVTRLGDVAYNLANMERILDHATKHNTCADLYIFPELSIIGGFFPGGIQANAENYKRLAEQVPFGPSCQQVARMAHQYQTHICAGLIEKDGDCYFITHVLFGPNELCLHQRKLFPQDPTRASVFTAGEILHTFELLGHQCTILACADWMEAETTILAGLAEVALILAPTGCHDDDQLPFTQKLMCAKAIGTDACIVGAFGQGRSSRPRIVSGLAFDPRGEVLVSDTRPLDQEVIHTLDLSPCPPRKRWGGFEARAGLLARNLRSYLPSEVD